MNIMYVCMCIIVCISGNDLFVPNAPDIWKTPVYLDVYICHIMYICHAIYSYTSSLQLCILNHIANVEHT